MSKKSLIQELVEEESEALTPRRRSTRIAAVVTRRASATEEPTTPAKITRTKRLSLSQESNLAKNKDDDQVSVSSAASSTQGRTTPRLRAASKSPQTKARASENKEVPAKRTRSRGSTSSVADEDERTASPAPTRLTRRSSARLGSISPTSEPQPTPTKATRRSTRGASASPAREIAAAKPASKVKGRRSSITEKIVPLESIEETESKVETEAPSENRKEEETEPKTKKGVVAKQNLHTIVETSFVEESQDLFESQTEPLAEQEDKTSEVEDNEGEKSDVEVPGMDVNKSPRKSPRLAEKEEVGSKAQETKAKSRLSLIKSKESEEELDEEIELKQVLGAPESNSPRKSPRKSLSGSESEKVAEKPKATDLDQSTSKEAPEFSLRISESDDAQEDVPKVNGKTDLNTSGSSNASDKENQKLKMNEIKSPKVDSAKKMLLSRSLKEVKESPVKAINKVTEASFCEPMDVDVTYIEEPKQAEESLVETVKSSVQASPCVVEESPKQTNKEQESPSLLKKSFTTDEASLQEVTKPLLEAPRRSPRKSLNMSESEVLKIDISSESLDLDKPKALAVSAESPLLSSPRRRSARLLKQSETPEPELEKSSSEIGATKDLIQEDNAKDQDTELVDKETNEDEIDVVGISEEDALKKPDDGSGLKNVASVGEKSEEEKVEEPRKVHEEEVEKRAEVKETHEEVKDTHEKEKEKHEEEKVHEEEKEKSHVEGPVIEGSRKENMTEEVQLLEESPKEQTSEQPSRQAAEKGDKSLLSPASDKNLSTSVVSPSGKSKKSKRKSRSSLPLDEKKSPATTKSKTDTKGSAKKVPKPKGVWDNTLSETEIEERKALSQKINILLAGQALLDDSSSSAESVADYLDDMAMEVDREDTPSVGSNDIVDEGEWIGSSETEIDSDESYELDSFIDDGEENELLSGEEYDLGQQKLPKKKKPSRIIKIPDSEDEDAKKEDASKKIVRNGIDEDSDLEKMSTQPYCGLTPPSVVSLRESLSDAEEVKADLKDDDQSSISVDISKKRESRTVDIVINKLDNLKSLEELKVTEVAKTPQGVKSSNILAVSTPNNSILESGDKNKSRKRLSSITIQENISLKDIEEGNVSDRISRVVDVFCSSVKKDGGDAAGNISLNISLGYLKSPEPESLENEKRKSLVRAASCEQLQSTLEQLDKSNKKKKKRSAEEIEIAEVSPKKHKSDLEIEASDSDMSEDLDEKLDEKYSSEEFLAEASSSSQKKSHESVSEEPVDVSTKKLKKKKKKKTLETDLTSEKKSKKHKSHSESSSDVVEIVDVVKIKKKKQKVAEAEEFVVPTKKAKKSKKVRESETEDEVFLENRNEFDVEPESKKDTEEFVAPTKKAKKSKKVRESETEEKRNDFNVEPEGAVKYPSKTRKRSPKTESFKPEKLNVDYFPSSVLQSVPVLKKPRKPKLVPSSNIGVESWECDLLDAKIMPSVSSNIVPKRKKRKTSGEVDRFLVKDFKNRMLYDSSRVTRMDTESLLKKKQKVKS